MVKQRRKQPQACLFCKSGIMPYFADVETLGKFLTDRGKIIGRERAGTCSKHQRKLTREIKRARFLALLPFINRV